MWCGEVWRVLAGLGSLGTLRRGWHSKVSHVLFRRCKAVMVVLGIAGYGVAWHVLVRQPWLVEVSSGKSC